MCAEEETLSTKVLGQWKMRRFPPTGTLKTPLYSHCRFFAHRLFFLMNQGLSQLAKLLLTMLSTKGVQNYPQAARISLPHF
jgi:hypothetical protein